MISNFSQTVLENMPTKWMRNQFKQNLHVLSNVLVKDLSSDGILKIDKTLITRIFHRPVKDSMFLQQYKQQLLWNIQLHNIKYVLE